MVSFENSTGMLPLKRISQTRELQGMCKIIIVYIKKKIKNNNQIKTLKKIQIRRFFFVYLHVMCPLESHEYAYLLLNYCNINFNWDLK